MAAKNEIKKIKLFVMLARSIILAMPARNGGQRLKPAKKPKITGERLERDRIFELEHKTDSGKNFVIEKKINRIEVNIKSVPAILGLEKKPI